MQAFLFFKSKYKTFFFKQQFYNLEVENEHIRMKTNSKKIQKPEMFKFSKISVINPNIIIIFNDVS